MVGLCEMAHHEMVERRGRDHLLDRVVEVEADAVTQNQDGSYSLRFPRFVRFRGFEKDEKL